VKKELRHWTFLVEYSAVQKCREGKVTGLREIEWRSIPLFLVSVGVHGIFITAKIFC
jgi:hypothetical protein